MQNCGVPILNSTFDWASHVYLHQPSHQPIQVAYFSHYFLTFIFLTFIFLTLFFTLFSAPPIVFAAPFTMNMELSPLAV